jgi:uncharacterized LabA/DUF88 family protein
MIVKNQDQRVVVLVDVQNMYYSAKNLYEAKVNFKNLLEDVVANRKLIRAIAYVIRAEVGKEAAFFEALNESGFDIREKELQVFAGGAKKGDWDVGISMDAIRYAEKVDTIILVSGDGDFVSLVDYLKTAKGCLVELAAFGRTSSRELKEKADDFLDIDSNKKRYLIQSQKRVIDPVRTVSKFNVFAKNKNEEQKPEIQSPTSNSNTQ